MENPLGEPHVRPFDYAEKMASIDRDMVNSPPHYNQSIECIEAMAAMANGCEMPSHQAYCWQNIFKYLWRWPYKNGVEDLKKCRWYLDRLISELETK
tara:strand:- start:150 stop:440 length:291 start_codon:yes stop_codon:yes gene_type:complete